MCMYKIKGSKRISLNSSAGQGGRNSSLNTSTRGIPTLSVTEYRKLFSKTTKAIVWGMQTRAVQSMLDFDFICRREEPSVSAMVSLNSAYLYFNNQINCLISGLSIYWLSSAKVLLGTQGNFNSCLQQDGRCLE